MQLTLIQEVVVGRAQEGKILFTDVMFRGSEHPEEGEDRVVWIVSQSSWENPHSLPHHVLLLHLLQVGYAKGDAGDPQGGVDLEPEGHQARFCDPRV